MRIYDPYGTAPRIPGATYGSESEPHGYDAAVLYGAQPDEFQIARAAASVDMNGAVYFSCPDGRKEGGLQATRLVDLAHELHKRGRIEKIATTDDGQLVAVLKPSKRRSKVIVWTGNAIGPWNPEDVETRGLGGSETAAWRLSQELAKLGYQVTLYGHFDGDRVLEDVILRHYDRYDPTKPVQAFVGFRDATRFDHRPNAQATILWLEDLAPAERLTPDRAANIDHIAAVTSWHRGQVLETHPWLPPEQVVACRNGIPHEFFTGPAPEREKRVVYTSSPDRGLDVLLELWPQIRERVPDATLVSTYSRWYDLCADMFPRAQWHRQRIMELMEQDGCSRITGGLGQRDLAHLMRASTVWCAPSWYTAGDMPFEETSCISAMEAQAAGCVVVASNWGALTETVAHGTLIDGSPKDEAWRHTFVDAIVKGLTDPDVQAAAQKVGPEMVKGMGWQGAAEQLTTLFERAPNGARPAPALALAA